jgi:Pvc16 N-terminal domain
MADAAGISHVTESLQALLRAAIAAGGPLSGTQVDLRSPREIGGTSNQTLLSFWLYRVRRLDELNNAPPQRRPDGRLSMRPLPLNLHYLLTPIASNPLTVQRLLGLAMQAFHQEPRLGADFLHPALLEALQPSVGIHLEPQTPEETTRIWHALHQPYQLSVAYLVQYVPIEATASAADAAPVLNRQTSFTAIERVQ